MCTCYDCNVHKHQSVNIRIHMCVSVSVCVYVCVYMCVYICDWICENVHSSHIQFFDFGELQNLFEMTGRCCTYRNCSTTIPLSSLKMSYLSNIPCGFCGSSNKQNKMCRQYMLSQIQSHAHAHTHTHTHK